MSLEEWADLPEDVPGELVDGRLVEDEVPGFFHERLVFRLGIELERWVQPLGGCVNISNVKFVVGPNGCMCDLSVWLPGGAIPPAEGVVREPPEIMIEIISRGAQHRRRDRVEKKSEYARFGVRFYWLLDPSEGTLEIFELGAAKHYKRILAASTGIVEVPGCPGLRLDLDALWAEGDRFRPSAAPTPRSKLPAPRSKKPAARPKKVTRKP